MIDPEKLAAFMLVTATTSVVPGPSMVFVMGQAIWRGTRAGWAALLGMQIGYFVWWLFAALGLGTLAKAYPLAFRILAIAGVAYLAWMGVKAIRHSFHTNEGQVSPGREPSSHAFRDGILVAIGNPKSLIYMVALIPPFVDPARPIGWQIVVLALVALVLDVIVGAAYIFAGRRLASVMERAATRRWIDRGIGILFLAIAVLILMDLLGTQL
ncbi:LysE family translocator [Qipengyuania sp. 6B39]|uniref:LysE family translocator n=1 Tax=Qipengyuania proteolytica TaxID=2867239 RepID=UPI001C88EC4E|nr:LysE family translocator [Qipengyuania proteolytica]MBX7495947.1 LysE family translocator [Qipengyuania proteolytica]